MTDETKIDNDIVARLRHRAVPWCAAANNDGSPVKVWRGHGEDDPLLVEAADEIERLREAQEWQTMDSCPLISGMELWVTDGESVSPVIVDRRFGVPCWLYEMEIAGTLPEFMKHWAFSDQDAPKNYCSSGNLPDDLIGYIPTHWMLRNVRPDPPK